MLLRNIAVSCLEEEFLKRVASQESFASSSLQSASPSTRMKKGEGFCGVKGSRGRSQSNRVLQSPSRAQTHAVNCLTAKPNNSSRLALSSLPMDASPASPADGRSGFPVKRTQIALFHTALSQVTQPDQLHLDTVSSRDGQDTNTTKVEM